MKLINFQPNNKKVNKPNKKKIAITIGIVVLIISIVILISIYITNSSFRNFLDRYIFQKNVEENNLNYIEINAEENQTVYAYDHYITVLEKNTLKQYNSSGKKESELKVDISNPMMESNGKYLAIAEKEKQKLYLISGNSILWEKTMEGNISRVNINKNGYVSVVLSGTTYKSVIVLYDETGKELFKTYRSTAVVVDSEISNDNKYLSFAKINTSGTLIQSNIEIISIEKAKEKPDESIVYTYEAPSNSLILNIKYQENNRLVCMYHDSIHVIQDQKDEQVMNLVEDNMKINFSDIELRNYTVRVIEKSSGLFKTESQIEIMNIANKKENLYLVEGVARSIYCYENVIGINLGSEVHFIDTNGWLIKKYSSTQEVRNIVIGSSMAGIVYRNKIEIISL